MRIQGRSWWNGSPETTGLVRARTAFGLSSRGEAREDVQLPLAALRMEEDGRLELEGQSVTLERAAFMQLAQLGGFGLGAR